MSSSSYYILFLYLLLDKSLFVVGKDSRCNSSMEKQLSNMKVALCQVNSKLSQTAEELGQLQKALKMTLLALHDIKAQLDRHIVKERQDHEILFKLRDQLLAKNNQPMQNKSTEIYKVRHGASQRPRDCSDVRAQGRNVSGIFLVYPGSQEKRIEMSVYCDFSSLKSSWLVFQRRKDGSENFNRRYSDYERGFGTLPGEFWLGNEKLHLLTSGRKYKLRIELIDFQGSKRYAEYSIFSVGSAANSYRLTVGGYSGNAGDSLAYHNGMKFTAKDVDNDVLPDANCGSTLRGGWWYKTCHASNLNGLYLQGGHKVYGAGIVWEYWLGFFYSLKSTEMKIAPK